MNFKIYFGSSSKAMTDREKKRGKIEIQKFEYLENEKSFLKPGSPTRKILLRA